MFKFIERIKIAKESAMIREKLAVLESQQTGYAEYKDMFGRTRQVHNLSHPDCRVYFDKKANNFIPKQK